MKIILNPAKSLKVLIFLTGTVLGIFFVNFPTIAGGAPLTCSELFMGPSNAQSAWQPIRLTALSNSLQVRISEIEHVDSPITRPLLAELKVIDRQILALLKKNQASSAEETKVVLKYIFAMNTIVLLKGEYSSSFGQASDFLKLLTDVDKMNTLADQLLALRPIIDLTFIGGNFKVERYNQLDGTLKFALGVTDKVEELDLNRLSPSVFTGHDIQHLFQYLESQFPRQFELKFYHLFDVENHGYPGKVNWPYIVKSKNFNLKKFNSRKRELMKFKNDLFVSLEQVASAELKAAIDVIWFYLSHESTFYLDVSNITAVVGSLLKLDKGILLGHNEEYYSDDVGAIISLRLTFNDVFGQRSDKDTYAILTNGLDWIQKYLSKNPIKN